MRERPGYPLGFQPQVVRGLLGLLWKNRLCAGLAALCVLLSDAAQLTVPLLTRGAIDPLVAGTATTALVAHQATLLGLAAGLTYAARYGWQYFMLQSARRAELQIRQALFDHALRLSATEHGQMRSGEVMALASNDLGSVRSALAFGLMAALDALIFLILGLGAMFWLDWKLAFCTLLPYPLLAILMRVAMDRSYRTWDRVQSSFEDFLEKTRESVAGMKVLRAYVQGIPDGADFQTRTQELYRRNMVYQRWEGIYTPAVLLLSGASMALLLGMGGSHVISGVTTLGSFVAFSAYLGQLTWPMMALGWTFTIVQRATVSMKRIEDFLARVPEPEQPLLAVAGAGAIQIRDLTFTYPGASQPALCGLNLEIPAGTCLGVVGEVGSGKSTLAQLLLRLYAAPRGAVFLDGVDVLDSNLGQLRAQFAWVHQEAFLFSDTIANNLALAAPGASRAELEEVSRLACLHPEVMAFPVGYDTLLGERGVTLSGGQRQRLSLARALLKRAPVLMLDDTLSAVDAETEQRILAALHERRRELGQTTLVISHRISAVKELDQIVVLEQGRLVQQGSHDELIAQPGLYRRLYELQRADTTPGEGQ